jgi:tetratricopeptide (TPR) repeat protein
VRRTFGALAGLVALLIGGDVDAAPASAEPASAEPATVQEPAAPAVPAKPTAAELLAAARAARSDGSKKWKPLARLLDEYDGTPEAVEAAVMVLADYRALWLKDGDAAPLVSQLRKVEASKSYALPEAAELRRIVAANRVEVADWQAVLDHVERGERGDQAAFLRCGEAAQAIVARLAARDPRTPWILHWSAQCFEAVGQWTEAAQAYERLLAVAPDSRWTQQSIASLVEGNFAVARYDDAARRAEQYAARFPKDQRTDDYLRIAYMSRLGLGQPDRALAALDRLEEFYVRRDPERAARFHWIRREALTDDDARLRHAEQFLVRHGRSGGLDRRIVAEVTLGQLKWRRACEKAPTLAACASLSRGPSPQQRTCGDRAAVRFEVFTRDAGQADEAQRYLASALKLAKYDVKIPVDDVARIDAFREALAAAAVLIADRGFDELLGLLEQVRDVHARDIRQPADLLARVAELAATLEQQYTQVINKQDSLAWSIAAAARIGQIAELRADALLLREIPRELTGKHAEAFCATRRQQVAPFHAAALAAYERCLELSIASGTFTESSRLCEDVLARRDPGRFPPLAEIVAVAAEPATRVETVAVQLEAPRELAAEGAGSHESAR